MSPWGRVCIALSLTVIVSCGERETATPGASTTRPAVAETTTQPVAIAEHAGLHNLFELGEGIISGSGPEGDAGFESLKAMGVRTILSVDGAAPEVEAARARGMQYVHIPVGYDGIPAQKQARIARAVRDLPKPVYVHCHHGKHRGPAAAASASVLLGQMTPDEAIGFLKQAGTSDMYTGLYDCVRQAAPADPKDLDIVAADFPEVAEVAGLVEAMVEVDERFEHLQLIRQAGWKVPEDHPDLVPKAEAARLAELLAGLDAESESQSDPQAFRSLLMNAAKHARTLNTLLAEPETARDQANASIEALKVSCSKCHKQYRDRTQPPKPADQPPVH